MQIQDNPSGADIIRPREAKRLPYNHLSLVLLRIRPWLSQRGGFNMGEAFCRFLLSKCKNYDILLYCADKIHIPHKIKENSEVSLCLLIF